MVSRRSQRHLPSSDRCRPGQARRELGVGDHPVLGALARSLGLGEDARASSGSAAALAVALAADLVAQVADASAEWSERGGALAQADAIRARAVALALEAAEAYAAAQDALTRAPEEAGGPAGAGRLDLGEALDRVVEPLLAIGEAASDAAALGELVARSGAGRVRADAVAATILATAAAEMAAHLIDVNLLVSGEDERSRRARKLVSAVAASRESARTMGL